MANVLAIQYATFTAGTQLSGLMNVEVIDRAILDASEDTQLTEKTRLAAAFLLATQLMMPSTVWPCYQAGLFADDLSEKPEITRVLYRILTFLADTALGGRLAFFEVDKGGLTFGRERRVTMFGREGCRVDYQLVSQMGISLQKFNDAFPRHCMAAFAQAILQLGNPLFTTASSLEPLCNSGKILFEESRAKWSAFCDAASEPSKS